MQRSVPTKPSIVFCHGIWADGSSFGKVIPALQAKGHEVMTVQYGLDTLAGDVAAVKRTLGRVSSPAILVGHSYGGTVITATGTDDRVAGLVYIARWPPTRRRRRRANKINFLGQTSSSTSKSRTGASGCFPDGVGCFAGDLSEEEQKVVWATRFAPAADLFNQRLDGTAWRSKPSCYIVAKNDRNVMGATTYELESSHVPMLSSPKFVIEVIRTAAAAVQGSTTAKATPMPGR